MISIAIGADDSCRRALAVATCALFLSPAVQRFINLVFLSATRLPRGLTARCCRGLCVLALRALPLGTRLATIPCFTATVARCSPNIQCACISTTADGCSKFIPVYPADIAMSHGPLRMTNKTYRLVCIPLCLCACACVSG